LQKKQQCLPTPTILVTFFYIFSEDSLLGNSKGIMSHQKFLVFLLILAACGMFALVEYLTGGVLLDLISGVIFSHQYDSF